MNMKQKEKEKDLVCLLKNNKCLAEPLSKVKEENDEKEKKMQHFGTNKAVGVDVCEFF